MAYAPAFNDVWFNATSSGSGDFVVASAVSGYRTPATAAIPNGTTVHYSARTATEYENGEGTYTSGTVTIARTTIYASSNSNAKVTFGSIPAVAICPLAEDTILGIVVPGTSAIVIGGSAASSTLTLRSTSGTGTSDSIVFQTGSQVEAMRIDTSQFVTIGGFASVQIGAQSANLQIVGPATEWSFSGITVGATTGTLGYAAAKTRGSTPSTQTIVVSGDQILEVSGWGSDGAAYQNAVAMRGYVDGTPGANDMPGRISFWTTPDGSTTIAERLRIDSAGAVTIGGNAQVNVGSALSRLQVVSTSADWALGYITTGNDAGASGMIACKTRGSTPSTNTIVASSDSIWNFHAYGNDGTAYQNCAGVLVQVDGTPGAGSMPGRWMFQTVASGSTTLVERFRIDSAGAIYLLSIGTTATAANCFINNGSSPVNSVLRSTSSVRYKTDITPVPQSRIDALMKLEPIEYKSLASADNPETRFVGLTAEAVAAVDPYLVSLDEHGRPDGVMYDRILLLQVAALRREIAMLKKRRK